jgi:DNA-binding transcriptional MerR regulator
MFYDGYVARVASQSEGVGTVVDRVFTAEKVERLTNLTKRQLQYWDEKSFLSPSIRNKAGRGHRRLYDFRDLVSLRVAADLRDNGASLQAIRKVAEHLRGLDYRHPLSELKVWSVNGRVYFEEADTVRSSRRPDQTVAVYEVPVPGVVNRLTEEVVQLDKERRAGKTETRRGALGSKTLIAGTRIPVETIHHLVRDGADEAEILMLYPDLTPEDVRAALAAERPKSRQRRAI